MKRKWGELRSAMQAQLRKGPKSTRQIGDALGVTREDANSLMQRAMRQSAVEICGHMRGNGGRFCNVYRHKGRFV